MWLTREELPKTIVINEREITLLTDFRNWIRFESIMMDKKIANNFKPYFMICSVIDDDYDKNESEDILSELFSFYRLNKPLKTSIAKSNEVGYSFDFDTDLILAAFRQQYNIDLLSINMHWWEFSSLFNGLNKYTKFIEVVGYRTSDTQKMPKEQKKQYEELKRFYALPKETGVNEKSQEEIEQEILVNIGSRGES